MKITTSVDGILELREIYNPVKLVTNAKEELFITMRDSGFEITYGGKKYSLKENVVDEITSKVLTLTDLEIPQTPQPSPYNNPSKCFRDNNLCHCGKPVYQNNPDCVEFRLCRDHAEDA